HQGVDGSHALPNENVAESGDRNGAARTGLQHEARDADSGYWRIDGRHAGLRRIIARPNHPRADGLRTSSDACGARFSKFCRADPPNPRRHAIGASIARVLTQPWVETGHRAWSLIAMPPLLCGDLRTLHSNPESALEDRRPVQWSKSWHSGHHNGLSGLCAQTHNDVLRYAVMICQLYLSATRDATPWRPVGIEYFIKRRPEWAF